MHSCVLPRVRRPFQGPDYTLRERCSGLIKVLSQVLKIRALLLENVSENVPKLLKEFHPFKAYKLLKPPAFTFSVNIPNHIITPTLCSVCSQILNA